MHCRRGAIDYGIQGLALCEDGIWALNIMEHLPIPLCFLKWVPLLFTVCLAVSISRFESANQQCKLSWLQRAECCMGV